MTTITEPAAAAAGDLAENEVAIAGELCRIEPVSARKSSVAFALLRRLRHVTEELAVERGKFEVRYAEANGIELDRVQAKMRFPARPLVDVDDVPIREPAEVESLVDGELVKTPNPRAGELIYAPSPVDSITAEEWAATGGRLRIPKSPDRWEVAAAMLPLALELAEDDVYRLLALFTLSNEEVKRARKDHPKGVMGALEERVEELMDDAMLDELVRLAAVAWKVVDEQFKTRLADVAGEVGNLLGLLRMTPRESPTTSASTGTSSTSESGPDDPSSSSSPSTTPTSSTSTPSDTAADSATPTPSSTSRSTSSPDSTGDSAATPTAPAEPSSQDRTESRP